MAKQLNIFLENRAGRMEAITETLLKSDINIFAFTIQNRGDFGVIRFLVDKPEQAFLVLSEKGFACALKNIVLVSVKDKPGNLHKLTRILLQHKINIVDTYGFVMLPARQGICSLELEGSQDIKGLLEKEGFSIIDETQLV